MSNNESYRSGSATDESKYYDRDLLNLIQQSDLFDWILLVEGRPDVSFYKNFVPFRPFDASTSEENTRLDDHFKYIIEYAERQFQKSKRTFETGQNSPQESQVVRSTAEILASQCKSDRLLQLAPENKICTRSPNNSEYKLCGKNRIIHILKYKIKFSKHNNFYAIVDKDYDDKEGNKLNELIDRAFPEEESPECSKNKCSLKNKIMVTDTNSLETLIIKGVTKEHFAKKILKRVYYLIKDEELRKIVDFAIKFSLRIGCLRKNKTIKLPYSAITDYSEYVQSSSNDFIFNEIDYLNKLIEINDSIYKEEKSYKQYDVNDLKQKINDGIQKKWKWYDVCQGHDIVYFIKAMAQKTGKYEQDKKFDTDIIVKTLNTNEIDMLGVSSKICSELTRLKNRIELCKPFSKEDKYKGYITAAAGDNKKKQKILDKSKYREYIKGVACGKLAIF